MKKYTILLLIIIISLGVFLIYKGFSIQTIKKEKIELLRDGIINYNKIVKEKDGLYLDNNIYSFKGINVNNYLKIYNRMYRIISIDNNGIKIISNKNEGVFYYGKNKDYLNSNINMWLNKKEDENTGVYSDTIKDKSMLVLDSLKQYFSILDIESYKNSGEKNSYLNNGESSFMIDKNNKVYIKEENGNITEETLYNTSSGIRAVMYLNNDIKIKKGKGTYKNPFIVDSGNSYINKYILLGEDLYQIFFEKDDLLKLKSMKVLNKKYNFSYNYSGFNPLNKNNIAYFLNNDYYNELSYKDYLKECNFYTGDIVESYNYLDNYKNKMSVKIGLINMFDLNISNFIDGYYLVNTSNDLSTISFSYDRFGHIIEDESNIVKKILPVICISSSDIVNGTGSKKNPYVLN